MKTYSLMMGVIALIITAFLIFPPISLQNTPTISTVQIGNLVIPVEIAKTPTEQQYGLSYRASLDKDKGMLFIFEKQGLYRFWMPNMSFPVDMIWVDENKRIISINENVPPLKDLSKPTYYQPTRPALYVLEVNANFSKKHNLKAGDLLVLKI